MRKTISLVPLMGLASAHSVFNNMFINGQAKPECLRMVNTNSPVTNVRSPDMRCNVGGSKGAAEVCAVKVRNSLGEEEKID